MHTQASHGKTRWPTLMSCLVLASPPSTPCWDNISCQWLGHVHCMEDGQIPKDILYGRAYLRAEKHWPPTAEVQGCIQERHEGGSTSTSIPGRTSPLTAPAGEVCFTNSCSPAKRSWQQWQQRREHTKRKWQPTDQSQCTDTTYATEIVTLTLVSTATGGTAKAEQTAWTSNGRIIINIHGQPWLTEAYDVCVRCVVRVGPYYDTSLSSTCTQGSRLACNMAPLCVRDTDG